MKYGCNVIKSRKVKDGEYFSDALFALFNNLNVLLSVQFMASHFSAFK